MALDFPPSPTVGQVFDSWQWDGVKWIAAGATPQFPLAVGAGGTGATDAPDALANLGAMGTVGGTFTGPITLSGNATANFQPVALGQMNGALAGYLPLTGGTLSGSLVVQGSGGLAVAGPFSVGGDAGITGYLQVTGVIQGNDQIQVGGDGFLFQDQGTQRVTYYNYGEANPWYDIWQVGTGLRAWSNNAGALIFQLDAGGNLGISGALTQGSDVTTKRNVEALPELDGMSLVRQLIPKSFEFNNDPNVTHWGFIAQDVQPVIPVAVTETEHMGNGDTTILSLDTTAILASITLAVKELDARLAALEGG